ncbi:MAG: hypothetical protein ABSD74_09275 [Rhizomicrobium sp.]|jgi:hypothetical protein
MWVESGLLITASLLLRHAFRELQGLAFLGGATLAIMLMLSALGLAADRSMWWWAYAVRHAVVHLATRY